MLQDHPLVAEQVFLGIRAGWEDIVEVFGTLDIIDGGESHENPFYATWRQAYCSEISWQKRIETELNVSSFRKRSFQTWHDAFCHENFYKGLCHDLPIEFEAKPDFCTWEQAFRYLEQCFTSDDDVDDFSSGSDSDDSDVSPVIWNVYFNR